jgi:molybdopterin-guanine dinucleotide biosynthesis protein A
MRARDVVLVLERLEAAGIPAWLDGGWGVDALLGARTRAHDDLDLVLALDRLDAAVAALRPLGLAPAADERPTRLALADAAGRRVDLHPVTFDAAGGGVQALPAGAAFRYPPEGFAGMGRVGGVAVRCLTAAVQVLCHLGYPPDADDRRDMRLLHERLGVALPAPYDERAPVAATGAVLAGGASRRMGRDKAALTFDGEPLLARVVRRLREATPEVLVVGPPERARLAAGARVVPDARPGAGPLGGIYTALCAAATPYCVVVACDMPFVRPALLRHLLDLAPGYAAVVPRSARGPEPLHAVYARECLPAIAALLDAGELAVAGLFGRVPTRLMAPEDWAPYDPDGLSAFNANTPEEWEAAQRGGPV